MECVLGICVRGNEQGQEFGRLASISEDLYSSFPELATVSRSGRVVRTHIEEPITGRAFDSLCTKCSGPPACIHIRNTSWAMGQFASVSDKWSVPLKRRTTWDEYSPNIFRQCTVAARRCFQRGASVEGRYTARTSRRRPDVAHFPLPCL